MYVLINIRVAVEPILRIPHRPGEKETKGLKNGKYPEQFHSFWLINLTVYFCKKARVISNSFQMCLLIISANPLGICRVMVILYRSFIAVTS